MQGGKESTVLGDKGKAGSGMTDIILKAKIFFIELMKSYSEIFYTS